MQSRDRNPGTERYTMAWWGVVEIEARSKSLTTGHESGAERRASERER